MYLELSRNELIVKLVAAISSYRITHPLRVCIDGIDCSGKTRLADDLVSPLTATGKPVIRASIDGFHNARIFRYRKGELSPEGYYHDSFNYSMLLEKLLDPLGSGGNGIVRLRDFDFRTNSKVMSKEETVSSDSILLFDGVFLQRAELKKHWDLVIFVDISFENSLLRAISRDVELFGSQDEVRRRYERRYIPGQKLYFNECNPKNLADIVIDNDDFSRPRLYIRNTALSTAG